MSQVCTCVIIISGRGGRFTSTPHFSCYKWQNYGDIPLRISALCRLKLWRVNKDNISALVYFLFNILQISEVKIIPELIYVGVFIFDQ
jgi:hypothetical protein